MLISAEVKTVVCGSVNIVQGSIDHKWNQPIGWRVAWLAFSVRTGAVRTLAQVTVRAAMPPYTFGLWISNSGNAIIGEGHDRQNWQLPEPARRRYQPRYVHADDVAAGRGPSRAQRHLVRNLRRGSNPAPPAAS
jgi:hypothetical protein